MDTTPTDAELLAALAAEKYDDGPSTAAADAARDIIREMPQWRQVTFMYPHVMKALDD